MLYFCFGPILHCISGPAGAKNLCLLSSLYRRSRSFWFLLWSEWSHWRGKECTLLADLQIQLWPWSCKEPSAPRWAQSQHHVKMVYTIRQTLYNIVYIYMYTLELRSPLTTIFWCFIWTGTICIFRLCIICIFRLHVMCAFRRFPSLFRLMVLHWSFRTPLNTK